MYSNCLFCHGRFKANEEVEEFPVGERLAFDASRGRLWVVCSGCQRWNLTPIESRWEAIEECERLFRQTPTRIATEQIALAVTKSGLNLIRIGQPILPEFAAWRYGKEMVRRRWRALFDVSLRGLALVLSQGLVSGANSDWEEESNRPLGSSLTAEGDIFVLRAFHGREARLDPDSSEDGWCLRLPEEWFGGAGRPLRLVGREAVKALRLALPAANSFGASASAVREAVQWIEQSGGPEQFMGEATALARAKGHRYSTLGSLPASIRYALEIAANENRERLTWEGELWVLEQEWREAEELAAISDSLLVPEEVDAFIRRVREREQGDSDPGSEAVLGR